jgi:NAD(P)-dependent dehydrogenase (short-subunit alcohol dehydrogenase family)
VGSIEPKLRLEDKVAIVTGAGSIAPGIGNGRAAAVLFLASDEAHHITGMVLSVDGGAALTSAALG